MRKTNHTEDYDFEDEDDEGTHRVRRFKKEKEHTREKQKSWDRESQYDRDHDYDERR